jgi:hypothetical protein
LLIIADSGYTPSRFWESEFDRCAEAPAVLNETESQTPDETSDC